MKKDKKLKLLLKKAAKIQEKIKKLRADGASVKQKQASKTKEKNSVSKNAGSSPVANKAKDKPAKTAESATLAPAG